jgi:ClpP class serine protease
MDEDRIRELGEGRVWMGVDAVENRLCDGLGTLGDAIALAKKTAGLAPGRKVRLEEYPPRPLFEWPKVGPGVPTLSRLFWPLVRPLVGAITGIVESPRTKAALAFVDGSEQALDYGLLYLRTLVEAAGKPVPMVPPDAVPDAWQEPD